MPSEKNSNSAESTRPSSKKYFHNHLFLWILLIILLVLIGVFVVNNSQNIRNLFLTPIKSPLFPKVNLNTLKNEYRNFTTAQKKELKSCVIAEMGTDKTQEVLEELRSKNLPDDYTLKVISDCINTVNKDGVDVDREKDSAGNDTELVKPALRDPSRWGDARCNDGTPFAFRVEKPQLASDTWIIYLQGGGMCDDNALSCQDRLASAPKLTTTFPGTDGQKSSQFSNSGIFNHDPKINPLFYHANKVHGSYCSSDLWSGNTSLRRKTSADPNGWYFSGRLNIKAIFESLTELYGLDDNNKNTKILLTGGSAGCMGANIGAEMAINYFPNAAKDGRLKLLSDGCFFPDFNNLEYPLGISDETSRQVLVKAYDFFGSVINTTCEKEQKNKNEPPGSCFLGAILHPYLTNCNGKGLCLPHLIQNSSIDHSLLVHLNIDPKPGPNNIGLELVRSQMLKELSAPDINWLFSGGNVSYHTLTQNDEMWQYGPGKGRTYGDVVNSFWKEEEPQKIIFGNP